MYSPALWVRRRGNGATAPHICVRLARVVAITALVLPTASRPPDARAALEISPAGTGNPWVVVSARPGQRVDGHFLVKNTGKRTESVKLHAVDAHVEPGGRFVPESDEAPTRDVGIWARPSISTVRPRPGATKRIAYTISVPRSAKPGRYAGAFIAQAKPKTKQASAGSQVLVIARLGLRIYLTVPEPPRRAGTTVWIPIACVAGVLAALIAVAAGIAFRHRRRSPI